MAELERDGGVIERLLSYGGGEVDAEVETCK